MMPSKSRGARPGHQPVKKLCEGCGKRSGNAAVSGKKLCVSCQSLTPKARNAAHPRHPRQTG